MSEITSASIMRAIRTDWPEIVERSKCRPEALDALPSGTIKILGSGYKTEKGRKRGLLTAICYMAPAGASGRNVCPMATEECIESCLGVTAGRMVMAPVKAAMLWKVALRFGHPAWYFALLSRELAAHARKADRLGLRARVRLDGTSDLGDAEKICGAHPEIGFYEYTKVHRRAFRWLAAADRRETANLTATLSFSGYNWAECEEYLRAGGCVAVASDLRKGEPKPAELYGFPTVNGDRDDNRFDDPAGHVVLLSWKGPRVNLASAGPFAVRISA